VQARASETAAPVEDVATSSVTSEPSLQPARLSFDHLETLVKEKSSNYHGFMSKDQQEVVFASDKLKVDGKKSYQCFIKKVGDSQEAQRLFAWPGNIWTPELTPDGNLVVFSSDSRKHEHIFVHDRQSQKSKALTSGLTKNMMPAISPDGTLIAYVSNEKGSNDIWLIGIDGSNKIQITSTEHDDREPRWLPDGRGLVFTRIFTR
jgi:TolB protein